MSIRAHDGSDRQSGRDGARAGEHARDPSNYGLFPNLTSPRKPEAIAGGRCSAAGFGNFCRCFNKVTPDPGLVWYPAADVRAGPGTKADSSFRGHSIDPWARQPPRGKCRNIGAGAALR
jgi:hypothetical protein